MSEIKSKKEERVVVLDQRGQGVMTFRKVDICYGNGELCYRGWIQIFGEEDGRNGPTVFPQNYANFNLDQEEVIRKALYWQTPDFSKENIEMREAVAEDLDEIIDLRFQGYFDDVYDRISAYQGLMHKIDSEHLTLVFTVDRVVYGLAYFDLTQRADLQNAYFDSWFCAPGMRSRGVGQALVKMGLKKMRQLGFERVSARVIGTEKHCIKNAGILKLCGFTVDDHYEDASGTLNVDLSIAL